WRWGLAAVAQAPPAREMVPAVRDRLAGLPPRLLRIVQVAATLGGPVDLPTLARGTRLAGGEVPDLVQAAVGEGLFAATGSGHYRFTHEVVRQAVRASRTSSERAEQDATVGQLLLSQPSPADPELVLRLCPHHSGDDGYRAGLAEQALAAS